MTGKTSATCRILATIAVTLTLCGFAAADTTAPQFSATDLGGQTFSNSSLRGNVVLLQFWTTWCPVCHSDQAAVDSVASEFAGDGLVVIAIDDGEPESLVRSYLQASPRAIPIVVKDGRSLAARFGVHGYPHYVVIDRNGNVVASRSGGGGEPYLRALLSRAGLGTKTQSMQASNRGAAANPGGPQWTNIGAVPPAIASKPEPKTIFVFTNGDRIEADHYSVRTGFVHVTTDGQDVSIPVSSLDVKKTEAVNRERGINLKLPASSNEVLLAF